MNASEARRSRRERDPEMQCGAESGFHDEGSFMDCELRIGHLGQHRHFRCGEIAWDHGSRPADEEVEG